MLAVLIPRLLKKLLKGRMELYLDIESGIFRNRAGDENMNLCGVRLVRRQDVPVSLSFLGRELEAGRVTLAAYHKRNGQLLAYQEGQITGGAVEMVVDFDTQEIRGAAREAEGKTIEARVAVLVETEEGKGVYHSLPLNFYLEPGLIGDEHLPNSARPEWEMMYETVVKKAEETEGYAGSALASKRAAADSAAAAGTSATNAARDAKSANDAKTDVESLAATWPETVSNGEKKIVEAGSKAVNAIQDKQANSVLAVGRAQKTATDKISGAQADAVSAVQAAGKEAQGTITPLVQRVETAKEAIDQAEGRINTAATNAANSATSAGNSATAAANALAAIPQVDAEGNMTLAGNITVMSASINGPFVAGRPDGTVSAGTCNQIYGITRFWQSLDVRSGGWWRGTMMYETGMLNIAQGASLNCIGPATFASTLNANGGVNIPLAVGAPTATGGVNRLYAAGMPGAPFFPTPSMLNACTVEVTENTPPGHKKLTCPLRIFSMAFFPASDFTTSSITLTGNGSHPYLLFRLHDAGKGKHARFFLFTGTAFQTCRHLRKNNLIHHLLLFCTLQELFQNCYSWGCKPSSSSPPPVPGSSSSGFSAAAATPPRFAPGITSCRVSPFRAHASLAIFKFRILLFTISSNVHP